MLSVSVSGMFAQCRFVFCYFSWQVEFSRGECNRVILVIPLATLLLSQWVFGLSLSCLHLLNMASYWLVCVACLRGGMFQLESSQ